MIGLVLDTKKKAVFLSIAIFAAALVIGYNFVYKANVRKARQAMIRIEEAKDTNKMLAEINGLQSGLDRYIGMAMDSPDPDAFMAKITDTAAGCKIKIDSVSLGRTVTENGYTLAPCKIAFSAPYHVLRLFMSRLEGDKKFIRIDGLSVVAVKTAKKKDAEEGVVNIVKKSRHDGVWVNVNMDITGFYAD